ncbi:MAG: MoaD/ThiS family protein [Myxococcota bacterium]|jgi:molybdopterin converting factor small subunit|nr:MoaD/ThiS family protein [Myxococcota bacterium]
MSIQVELTYDMGKAIGEHRFEVEAAATVADVVEQTRQRFKEGGDEFAKLAHVTRVAVNGVLVKHSKGMKTALKDGDRVGFVKASAGG